MTRQITAAAFTGVAASDLPTAVGWRHIAEVSDLRAGLLLREVAELGLSDDQGARHLALTEDGPASHWHAFTAGLDPVAPSADEKARMVAGAKAAVARVRDLADAAFT